MYCTQCKYDLRGQTDARCPECGRAFDFDDSTTFYTSRGGFVARSISWVCGFVRRNWRRLYIGLGVYFLVLTLALALVGRFDTRYRDRVWQFEVFKASVHLKCAHRSWVMKCHEQGGADFDRSRAGRDCGTSNTIREFRIQYSIWRWSRELLLITVPLTLFCAMTTMAFWHSDRKRRVFGSVAVVAITAQTVLGVLNHKSASIWPQSYDYLNDFVFLDGLDWSDGYAPDTIAAYQRERWFGGLRLIGTMDGRELSVQENGSEPLAAALRQILEGDVRSEPRP